MQGSMKQALLERAKNKGVILEAHNFAEKAHLGQKRKTGEDYITHCIAVADILVSYGADDETLAAAYLHDVVEDTKVSLEEIDKKFGGEIAFLVDGVTKPKKDMRWQTAFEKVRDYSKKDKRVLLIKLADRIHNLETPIGIEGWKSKYRRTTKDYILLARYHSYVNIARRLEGLINNLN